MSPEKPNLVEALRPIATFESRRHIILANIDNLIGPIQPSGRQGKIISAFKSRSIRTQVAVKEGVSYALAARSRTELQNAIPQAFLLDELTRREGSAHQEEVVENFGAQNELNALSKRQRPMGRRERCRFAATIAKLALTAIPIEDKTHTPIKDRMRFLELCASVITGFIIDHNPDLVQADDLPTSHARKQELGAGTSEGQEPTDRPDIIAIINQALGDGS